MKDEDGITVRTGEEDTAEVKDLDFLALTHGLIERFNSVCENYDPAEVCFGWSFDMAVNKDQTKIQIIATIERLP